MRRAKNKNLTTRQEEIIQLLWDDIPTKKISQALKLNQSTVNYHLAALFKIHKVNSQVGLCRKMLNDGWLEP